MTRHNLASHISWLLSNENTPPVGVPAIASNHSAVAAEVSYAGLAEEDTNQPISRTSVNPPVTQSVNVGQGFQRPALPSTDSQNPRVRDQTKSVVEESMGRLSSTSRSTRPGLVIQNQLATPASTTGSSSLTQGYATFLRASNGTPSSRPVERLPSNIARPVQTPQTPKQTPRPTSKLRLDNVESVDLTGDNDVHAEQASSSPSSAEMFGLSQVIWTEEAAWRPEPVESSQPRSKAGKKRKSDEISTGSVKNSASKNRRTEKPRRDQRADSEDFMDIDDMITIHPQSNRPKSGKSSVGSVLPTVETTLKDVFAEEYSITETISRVGTQTKKSVSRLPSVDEAPTVSRIARSPTLSRIGSQSNSGRATTPRPISMIQVTASPARESAKSSPTRAVGTPKKRQKVPQDRIIRDSDDEDEDDEPISMERQSKFSPRTSVKDSPKVIDTSRSSPRRKDIPLFEPSSHKVRDSKDTRPRISSPLRPISRNIAIRQDSVPSPFQRDSPTKVSHAAKSQQNSSQQTPSSTLTDDERKLANLFLTQALSIASYHLRVKNLLDRNAIESMSYIDEKQVAPPELKAQRQALVKMEKAYVALENLGERYRDTIAEKRVIARKVLELLDNGVDTSVQEERASLLTQEIREIERETVRLLHASGAIEDGFGTGSDDDKTVTPAPASTNRDFLGSAPQGSSVVANTQIIYQTQIPSLEQNPVSISSKRTQGQPTLQSEPAVSRERFGNPASPCRTGRAAPPEPVVEEYNPAREQDDWPRPQTGLRQPNFYRDPTPMDFGFDGTDDIDGWLQDEQEILEATRARNEVQEDVDDYGECDDDDDMLEFAQEVEQRHSLPDTLPRNALSEASGNMPNPPKRTHPTDGKNMYSHVEQENAAIRKLPWYRDVKRALRERFKLTGFRHHQLDAINATLDGKDAFVLMPTGGGKSLCYQLPAVIQSGRTKGLTVVISPLLSLMSDQVDHLRKLNIRAATLNSEIPPDQKREIMSHLRESDPEQFIELLYITPEMINKSGAIQTLLTRLHKNKKLARIVIDEAHCVSQWGHDFRPDYVALGGVRKLFPNVPYMALTATATENVKVDVMHNLGMERATVYAQSFNRPNLYYEVRSKKGKGKAKELLDDISELIHTKYHNQTGIVYTLSRKNCEQMAEKLQDQYGISAHHFHASMKADEKARVQRQWQNGQIKVVVATIAFGMGIDKPDVRFVIHHTIPKSLEGYYQETGRAGRDGKMSGCYLYYGYQDTKVLRDFIYESEGTEQQKERQRKMLQNMIQYCENRSDCRRVQVLHYFGESFSKEECNGTCDNCKSDAVFKTMDFTSVAQAALDLVERLMESRVTLLYCVDILRGANSTKIKNLGHDDLEEFGAAKHLPRGEVERLFYRLLMENALAELNVVNRANFVTQYLELGPNCDDFRTGRRKLKLQVKVSGSPATASRQIQSKPTANPSTSRAGSSTSRAGAAFQSSLFTSPTDVPQRRVRTNRRDPDKEMHDNGYARDGFVVSSDCDDDDEYFEPPPDRRRQRRTPGDGLGPPITADERMAALPEMHRVFVYQFVEEAKREVDKIKNDKNLAKPFFTEANLREMAISWTVTLEDMRRIPGINPDAVAKWGKKFIPLIERYSSHYDEAMSGYEDRDIDKNHQNVIDLVSDDEDEYGLGESDEEALRQTEQGSKYFQTPQAPAFNDHAARVGRPLPMRAESRANSAAPKKSYSRGNAFPFRGRGRSKKGGARRSYGSNSGQSSSGVAKRRSSGASKRSGTSKASASTSKSESIFKRFANPSTSGGRGGNSGIGMMPT